MVESMRDSVKAAPKHQARIASAVGSVMLVVACACASAREAPAVPSPSLDPETVTGVLANGMHYYVHASRVPSGHTELRLVVRASAELDEPGLEGTAHFLEHMAFRGTSHFPANSLLAALRGAGIRFGADVNASTGYDATVYRIAVPAGSSVDTERALIILHDWAQGMSLDSAQVEVERGVVLEEWRSRLGRSARLRAREDSILYAGTAYAKHDPVGDSSSIARIGAADLRRFYARWYRPRRMAIVAVGDVDPRAIEARIRSMFETWREPPSPPREHHPEAGSARIPSVAILADPSVSVARVAMLRRAAGENSATLAGFRERVADDLYANLLGDRLLELAADSTRPFGSWAITSDARQPTGAYRRVAVTAPDGDVVRALTAVLTANESVARYGFTTAEIARGRAVLLRTLASDSAASESDERVAQACIDDFLRRAPLLNAAQRGALTRQALTSITAAELRARATAWRDSVDRMVLVTVPGSGGAQRVPAASLEQIFLDVQREAVTPHVDRAVGRELLGRIPPRGAIVDERLVADGQVLQWTLSNGARVLLEQTANEPAGILVRGYGAGGLATAPNSEYATARLATELLATGGLGTHDAADLARHLAGSSVQVRAEIGERSQAITGSGAPADAELLFQLLHLQFTAPRLDTMAVRSWRAQRRAELEESEREPAGIVATILSQGEARGAPTAAQLDSVDAQGALRFYRERFGDASRLTFVIVGAFTPSAIRPLVTRYLASLPSAWTASRVFDAYDDAPGGRAVLRRALLSEPRAESFAMYRGSIVFDRDSLYALQSLADVLQLRLMERLRESLGGTYGVSVQVHTVPPPRSRYELSIEYESSPDRSEALESALREEIVALREEGPSAREVAEVAAMQRQALASAFRDDAFWLRGVEQWDRFGWPMNDGQRSLASLVWPDRELLRRAARRFLDEANLVRITLLPARDEGSTRP
jgi:zinc protease